MDGVTEDGVATPAAGSDVGDGERRGGRHCPVDQTRGAHSRSGAPARRATQAPAQVSGVGELEKELDGGRAVPLAGALGEEADGCGDGYVGGVVSRGLEGSWDGEALPASGLVEFCRMENTGKAGEIPRPRSFQTAQKIGTGDTAPRVSRPGKSRGTRQEIALPK